GSMMPAGLAASPLAHTLVDSALKGLFVFAVAAIVVWELRRRPASARHSVWALALALQLAIPLLIVAVPRWNIAVLPPRYQAAALDLTRGDSVPTASAPANPGLPAANRALAAGNTSAGQMTVRTPFPWPSILL